MLLKLYQVGQSVLREEAKVVSAAQLKSKKTQDIIDFMISTLRDAPGVGLAAPQVGEALRIVIIEDKAKYHQPIPKELLKEQGRKVVLLKVLINPEIEIIDEDSSIYFEGCLSVDGYVAAVPRYKVVRVKALGRDGKSLSYLAFDWQARILQHEVDHLDGTIYMDKMLKNSFMNINNFAKLWRTEKQAKIISAFNSKNATIN
jgi:peptide deformylase